MIGSFALPNKLLNVSKQPALRAARFSTCAHTKQRYRAGLLNSTTTQQTTQTNFCIPKAHVNMLAYKEALHIHYNTFNNLVHTLQICHIHFEREEINTQYTINSIGILHYLIHCSIPHHHSQYVKESLQNTNIHMHNLPTDIG